MNAAQWRELGYKTIFRWGRIYLVRPMTGTCICTSIGNGDWMLFDNVNKEPWLKVPEGIMGLTTNLMQDIEQTIQSCYCDQGVGTCDFCSGVR